VAVEKCVFSAEIPELWVPGTLPFSKFRRRSSAQEPFGECRGRSVPVVRGTSLLVRLWGEDFSYVLLDFHPLSLSLSSFLLLQKAQDEGVCLRNCDLLCELPEIGVSPRDTAGRSTSL